MGREIEEVLTDDLLSSREEEIELDLLLDVLVTRGPSGDAVHDANAMPAKRRRDRLAPTGVSSSEKLDDVRAVEARDLRRRRRHLARVGKGLAERRCFARRRIERVLRWKGVLRRSEHVHEVNSRLASVPRLGLVEISAKLRVGRRPRRAPQILDQQQQLLDEALPDDRIPLVEGHPQRLTIKNLVLDRARLDLVRPRGARALGVGGREGSEGRARHVDAAVAVARSGGEEQGTDRAEMGEPALRDRRDEPSDGEAKRKHGGYDARLLPCRIR